MTSADPTGPASPPDARLADIQALSEHWPRFMRLTHALKGQMAGADRDRAARILLFPLARLGPLRQGALADHVHSDPSTVSRHVAALVDQGLVRRVADETDGRASRLVVTDAGLEAVEVLRREREAHLARVTAGWDPADLATLTTLFGRLLDDLAATLPGSAEPGPADLDSARENR